MIASSEPAWVWPIVVVAAPLWSCLVIFGLSRLGWHQWWRRFPGGPTRPPDGVTYSWRSARTGRFGTRYNNCLKVTVASAGLYVVPLFLFRLFHPPLLLPWSCVRSVETQQVLGFRGLELLCEADGRVFKFYLPSDAAETVERFQAAARSGL